MVNNEVDYRFRQGERTYLFHFFHEHFCGLESWDLVFGNDDSSILGDIAGSLFAAGLYDEASETTEVNVFTVSQRVLHNFHKLFDGDKYVGLVDACSFGNFVNDVGFSHC